MLAFLFYGISFACLLLLLNFRFSWISTNISFWKQNWKLVLAILLALWALVNPIWVFMLNALNVHQKMKTPKGSNNEDPENPIGHKKTALNPAIERFCYSLLTVALLSFCYWFIVWFFTIPHELEHCPLLISGPPGSKHLTRLGAVPGFNQQFTCIIDASKPTYRNSFGDDVKVNGTLDIYLGSFESKMPDHALITRVEYECFHVLFRCTIEYDPSAAVLRLRDVPPDVNELPTIPPQAHRSPITAFFVAMIAFVILVIFTFVCALPLIAVLIIFCCCQAIVFRRPVAYSEL